MANFEKVEDALATAKAITWDTCHKIYVLMDDEQVALVREYGYDPIILASDMNPYDLLQTIQQWFEQSCSLKFVSAVTTNHADPNLGFKDLIAQFEDDEDEDEDE